MNKLDIGKVPPQAVELEEAVLGAVMLEKDAINVVEDILEPRSFYKDVNVIIYEAILSLHRKSNPVDILTVTQELIKLKKLDQVGGAYYITQLTNRVASAANVEFHARIVAQKFIQRELIRVSSETINKAYADDSDVFQVLEDHEKDLTSITKTFTVGKVETIGSLWGQIVDRNAVLLEKKGLTGVPSGFHNIDKITGGWQQPDLIILAARPAMGKTAFVCNLARNASVDFKKPVAIFSLEMSALQIGVRFFSGEANISTSQLFKKGVKEEEIISMSKDCSQLIDAPLYIDDTAGLSLSQLRTKARKLKREKDIQMIIIDYLQLMVGQKDGSKQNREQEISTISRGLKVLAKELQIPIIALSQLSRAVETRGGEKRPQLSDLRESGAIEQDADIVIFLHRPEYYGIREYDNGESTYGVAEVIFAKHRNGGLGTEKLGFVASQTKFIPPISKDFEGIVPQQQTDDLPF